MFPLSGKAFPTNTSELVSAIQQALAQALTFPSNAKPVRAEGGSFPAIDKLQIDLSGASVKLGIPSAPPKPSGKRKPGITADQFRVKADPIFLEKSKAQLDLSASDVSIDFATDTEGNPLALLKSASDGKLTARISKADFNAMLLAAASVAAKAQGVSIQELSVDLQNDGPRALNISARVKAKKMVMSGVITVRGRADLDQKMNATLSGLSCTGEGMIGNMAAGFLQKKLNELDGKRFPLMAMSLGDVTLRDVQIQTTPDIQLTAGFGS